MYCVVTGANDEECKEKAKKYFESQVRSLGWGRITTLKSIRPLRARPRRICRNLNNVVRFPSRGARRAPGPVSK